tara:strand:+ start:2825 stop:3100 length:276 start_codon:yes stop_codon:yes gene_type:complete
MINLKFKKIFFRYSDLLGEKGIADLFQILTKVVENDRSLHLTYIGDNMSNTNVWVVVDQYGREIRRFSGTSAALAARDYARMIKGTAHCIG